MFYPQVRHGALKASVAYLTSADPVVRAQAAGLMHSMLEVRATHQFMILPAHHQHITSILSLLLGFHTLS